MLMRKPALIAEVARRQGFISSAREMELKLKARNHVEVSKEILFILI
jgi:hypothetical protein